MILLQLIVSGTATGAIYALAALGFTLLWQASGTINFAQGEFVMVPAFVMLFFLHTAGLPLWLAFLLTCLVAMLLLGYTFKRAMVDPLIRHGVIPLVIATLGPVDRRQAAGQGRRHRTGAAVRQSVPGRPAGAGRIEGVVRRPGDAAACRLDRRRSADVPQPHGHRPRDAGGGAEHRGREGARHQRQADGAVHVPDQRGAGRRRRAAGDADLPRQVRHGRFDRPEGVLRGDHRRLQPDARRAAGRGPGRRAREPRRRVTSRRRTRKASR